MGKKLGKQDKSTKLLAFCPKRLPDYALHWKKFLPLSKYPGNSLCNIFILIGLLALVSLAILCQENEISGRIRAAATFILDYIALIPSIRQ